MKPPGLPSSQNLNLTSADLLKPPPWAVEANSTSSNLDRRIICTFRLLEDRKDCNWNGGAYPSNM